MNEALTHLDADGRPRMVDVGDKAVTARMATAQARVLLPEACRAVLAAGGDTRKGNVFQVARIAGIQAAKRTADLIPLCHPLPLDAIAVDISVSEAVCTITASVRCTARTGVEMEALTAASITALTIYDMLKAVSHDLVISDIALLSKSGGRSGLYERTPA